MLSRESCVEFEGVKVLAATDNAIRVNIEGQNLWIPKSQIHDDSEVYTTDTEGTLVISEWIAVQKGLV